MFIIKSSNIHHQNPEGKKLNYANSDERIPKQIKTNSLTFLVQIKTNSSKSKRTSIKLFIPNPTK